MFDGEIFFNRAAINDESIPPDKKAPTSTSALHLLKTDCSNNSLNFSLEIIVYL